MPKKALITSGPTWVALDAVRIITNVSSGQTGFLLAKEAEKRGYDVTLALGSVERIDNSCLPKIKRFRYFNELLQLIKNELKAKRYDVVIHAAAVSDYQPQRPLKGKISSARKGLSIRFRPTEKIVNWIKKIEPLTYLVLFKLEYGVSDKVLISRARKALFRARADLAVANRLTPRYKAFIVDKDNIYARVNSKQELSKKLFDIIDQEV